MIVRLKELAHAGRTDVHRFQFYDSPIKRKDLRCYDFLKKKCFNSMIVRLKVREGLQAIHHTPRFNSMIVRLKAATPFALYGDYTQVSIL